MEESTEPEMNVDAGCAGGDAVVLSEEQAIQVGDVTERLRHIEGMVAQAREFGNPHIVMTLEQARYTLLKQCVGAKQTDPAVARAAREARPNDEEHLMDARRKLTAARRQEAADRRAADSGKAKLPASRTFRIECRRLRLLRLAQHSKSEAACAAPKGFDAADLGQGAKGGGTAWHRKNRLDLFSRVCLRFPRLSGAMTNELERAFKIWDASMARQHSAAWGHMMRDEMRRLIDAADKGNSEELKLFCRRVLKHMPNPELVL